MNNLQITFEYDPKLSGMSLQAKIQSNFKANPSKRPPYTCYCMHTQPTNKRFLLGN